ncbi:MAG: hypothetical protein Q4C54_04670, partial [Clostridia bacterium]|nr:hypothetical protein [Clostridia bacterium]
TPVPQNIALMDKAAVKLTGEAKPLKCLRKVDGILMEADPRVYQADTVLVNAEDICGAMDGWYFHKASDTSFEIKLGDKIIQLDWDADRNVMTITGEDGETVEATAKQLRMHEDGVLLGADFLREYLRTDAQWQPATSILTLTKQG